MALTDLIGRERDVAEVERLVADNRLVTLVGPGGVGKTRLAIEEAATVSSGFADGVHLVDLSGVPNRAALLSAVARMAGVEERADDDLAQRVIRILRPQNRLMVLDNCEHLLAECALIVKELLEYCPGLRILATSRECLGVPGEATWRVLSLTFPYPDNPPSLATLGHFSAVSLFADRARAARPGLVIEASDIDALTSICFRLDGIPLALELAAARVSALSIKEIAERLDDRFMLLSRAVGGPARHHTLWVSVDWSYQLLSELERRMLCRLAAFAGGWSLSAAETVCAAAPVRPDQVARLLAALVDKSLVQIEDSHDGSRYRLLQVIKAFAHDRLVLSGELDEVRELHGRYFAGLGEEAPSRLHGPGQDQYARCLDQEHSNLRAARLWCAADPARAGLGLKMASGLWEHWLIRGLLEEGIGWLAEAVRRASSPTGGARADALTGLAVMTSLRGDFHWAGELLAASIALHEEAGNRQGQARSWAILGFWHANHGDREGAAVALDYALALARQSRDRYPAAFARLMAGMAAALLGDTALARERANESAALFTEIGDRRGAGYAQCVLADCLISEGTPANAVVTLQTCVGTFEALLDRWGLLISTSSVARAYATLCDWPQASFVLGVADSLSERIGGHMFPGAQAVVDAVAAKITAELGAELTPEREAGRRAGRGDGIAAVLGADPGAAPLALAAPESVLTRREREITELIAGGLTNRQIAKRLFIAQRTVDTHVGHILAKLGCRNRSQVAALTGVGRRIELPDAAVLSRCMA